MTRNHMHGLIRAHSISRRASLVQLGITAFIVLCFSCAIILFTAYRLNVQLEEQTDRICALAETSLASAVWQIDQSSARDFIDAVFRDETVVFAQVTTGREIMASKSRAQYAGMPFKAFTREHVFITKDIPIRKNGDWIGSFRLVVSTEANNTEVWIYSCAILGFALLLIMAISQTTIRFTQKIFFAPLARLEESAALIADGDLDAPIDTSAPNELGSLARAIDDMRESVRHLIQDLQGANTKLQKYQDILESRVRERTEELNAKNTSLNNALEEVRKSKKAADIANLAKSSFLASMSHEIRTPMNAILGMADVLWETELTEDQKEYVDVFRTAGEALLEILNDVLDLSKIEAGYMELEGTWFSLNEILDKTCALVDAQVYQKQLTLSCEVSNGIPDKLHGDPARLRQILVNLLGNAVKFTEKGSVSLTVEKMPNPGDEVLLQFSVADTGMGIPGQKLTTIFDAFTQADNSTTRKFGGTGLGLAISRKLAQLMGGRIWAESTPGKGSTFHFTARFKGDSEAAPVPTAFPTANKELPQLPTANILMFEDSNYNAFVIQTYLKDTSCSITVVENGRDGVEAFKNGTWDLVLMDIQMPIMNGYEATRTIREWEQKNGVAQVPIIAMTAYTLNEEAKQCLSAGANHHLPKPVKKSALFDAIRRFAGTTPSSEE
ncbi:ATP-binding protein [Pseudodesulfovibrio sediminis]|uniref:histidine kinase n=1 Tax=Pseudodesulfovibrio sediminis TaxID=2810563 RepID=A0ABM7P5R9_9BACT|nr:ATP-binding protein [Pseudodesulfovibrio sediminis]BCS88273.1 hypothetical protein PSDVSF_15150 [Pseudodesulfovibrio sediminis]